MTAAATRSWNQAIIDEFRANGGAVGGHFAGVPLALVHHKGARSGTERVVPLAAQVVDNGIAVFASKGGANSNPGWYHNLLANPDTIVEFGRERFAVRAYEAQGEEYQRIWTKQKSAHPAFGAYERRTARAYIPVMVLERR